MLLPELCIQVCEVRDHRAGPHARLPTEPLPRIALTPSASRPPCPYPFSYPLTCTYLFTSSARMCSKLVPWIQSRTRTRAHHRTHPARGSSSRTNPGPSRTPTYTVFTCIDLSENRSLAKQVLPRHHLKTSSVKRSPRCSARRCGTAGSGASGSCTCTRMGAQATSVLLQHLTRYGRQDTSPCALPACRATSRCRPADGALHGRPLVRWLFLSFFLSARTPLPPHRCAAVRGRRMRAA
jgi:hypothetical protein